jgi:hypothetical protein
MFDLKGMISKAFYNIANMRNCMSLVGSKNCTDTKSEPYSSSDELIET